MATGSYKQLLKILLLGESSSGKSNLLSAYINENSSNNARTDTTGGGLDFKTKPVEIDGRLIKLQLWDTAGLERFRSMTSSFYRGAHGILMVFDVEDELSFNSIQYWLKEVDEHVRTPSIPKFVVGNITESDHNERQVTAERAKDFAESADMRYVEFSLKDQESINVIFGDMAASIMEMLDLKQSTNKEGSSQGPILNQPNPAGEPHRKCCN